MNILMKMFQGGYVLQDGKIGHEFINLIKSDDNSFYIWLNSMGTFDKDETSGINILMIRTLSGGLYSVLGKAINCEVVEGANPKIYKTPEERYACQSHIKYNDKSLGDIHAYEKNTLVTFKTQYVYKPKKPIFITTNDNSVNNINIFKLNFKSKTSMREYIDDSDANIEFNNILDNPTIWEENVSKDTILDFINKYSGLFNNKETMFSILKKEKEELAISNSISYFCEKYNCIDSFLASLNPKITKKQKYELYREKNNMDLFFIGEKDIVVIENKIDSKINGISEKTTFEDQINSILKMLKTLLDDYKINVENLRKELLSLGENVPGEISQLSKYYIISYIYSKCRNIENIHFFLLAPNYSSVLYPTDNNRNVMKCSGTLLKFSDKYKLIGYDSIYDFFNSIELKYHDIYFEDFLDTIKKLTKDYDCVYESKIAEALKIKYNE